VGSRRAGGGADVPGVRRRHTPGFSLLTTLQVTLFLWVRLVIKSCAPFSRVLPPLPPPHSTDIFHFFRISTTPSFPPRRKALGANPPSPLVYFALSIHCLRSLLAFSSCLLFFSPFKNEICLCGVRAALTMQVRC